VRPPHDLSAGGATRRRDGCQYSGRGEPPVSGVPISDQWEGRHVPVGGVPHSIGRGATNPSKPRHFSERTPPLWRLSYLVLENDLLRQRAGLAVESGSPRPRKWIPSPTSVDPLAQQWCSPSRDRVQVQRVCRAPHSATQCGVSRRPAPPLRASRHPPDDTRCPARRRPIRTRLRPGDPCRAMAGRGRSASVLPPSAPRDPTVASRDPQPVLIDQARRDMVVTPDGLDDGGAPSVNQYHGRRRSTQRPQSTQRLSSITQCASSLRLRILCSSWSS
jgi:hypothetical protein